MPDDAPKWTFPALELRIWQQFVTKNVVNRQKTVSRACTVCGQFFLRRYFHEKDLDADGKRFVKDNLTPCEAKRGKRR